MAALSPAIRPDRETIQEIFKAAATPPVPGFRADREGSGCTVFVHGYSRVRNGRPEQVSGYQRSNPDCAAGEDMAVQQAMARRPGPFDNPYGKPPLLEGDGGGMVNRGGPPPRRPAPAAPQGSRTPTPPGAGAPAPQPSQSLPEILAPGGDPIGTPRPRSLRSVRGMPGGDPAARDMFDRLTAGRGGVNITPPGHKGKLVRLPDGSTIGYRPTSDSGGPTIDVNIPSFKTVRRLHY